MTAGSYATISMRAENSDHIYRLHRKDGTVVALDGVPSERSATLGILFDTACPTSCFAGRSVLQTLWVEEAIHRASNFLRFILLLEGSSWKGESTETDTYRERRLAIRLAGAFRALDRDDEHAMVPCSDLLRRIVVDLVDLFGPTTGRIAIETDLMPLNLSACKRRALVLVATELVINALKHAFQGHRKGQIAVTLERVGRGQARFVVDDSGRGVSVTRAGAGRAIISGLARVLDADLLYRTSRLGGSAAEFEFAVE
jgi:two-component sensor histidine kinase